MAPPNDSSATAALAASAQSMLSARAWVKLLWLEVTFGWVRRLLRAAWTQQLEEQDAQQLLSKLPPDLSDSCNALVSAYEEDDRTAGGQSSTARLLLRLHWQSLLAQCATAVACIVSRLAVPVMLRGLLVALQQPGAAPGPWAWAAGLMAWVTVMVLAFQQLLWRGSCLGLTAQWQVLAALHHQLLAKPATTTCIDAGGSHAAQEHSNSTGKQQAEGPSQAAGGPGSVSHDPSKQGADSAGQLINLAANDLRRIEEALFFWAFLWIGPVETLAVLIMAAHELGWGPASAGVGVMALAIPFQVCLAGPLSRFMQEGSACGDKRVALTREAIQGVQLIKVLCWERLMLKTLAAARAREVYWSGRTAQIKAAVMAMIFFIIPLAALAAFGVHSAMGGTLTIAQVFYVVALLALPRLTMVEYFAQGAIYVTEVLVALQRVDVLLARTGQQHTGPPPEPVLLNEAANAQSPCCHQLASGGPDCSGQCRGELEAPAVAGTAIKDGSSPFLPAAPVPVGTVLVHGADFYRAASEAAAGVGPALSGISLRLRPGELLGVTGSVGCGKSTLLAALLGELVACPADKQGSSDNLALHHMDSSQDLGIRISVTSTPGHTHQPLVTVAGSISYCSQVACIMPGSLRDNILFGAALDPGRYAAAVEAACLTRDLALLPAGDATELGEGGFNLSGGQKARVAMARAVYAAADVTLLDDPLSALDPAVARRVFEACLGPGSLLGSSTRVLVTHQRQYLPCCDRVAVLQGGRLIAVGSWQELEQLQLPDLHLELDEDSVADAATTPLASVDQNNTSKDKATTPYDKQDTTTASEVDQDITRRSVDQLAEEAPPQVQVNGMGQLAVEEIIQTGAVPWKVYKQYAALMGWPVLLLLLVCLLTCQACNILSQWWLAMWASAPPSQQHQPMWCGVLAALVVGVMLAAQLGSSVHYEWTLRAASSLYNAMLRGLLYAPLSVFHTNPAGRILNRFSSDLGRLDDRLPTNLLYTLQICLQAVAAVLLLGVVVPWVLPVVALLLALLGYQCWRYMTASRQFVRLEAVTKSPLFGCLSAHIRGLTTIQAYRAQHHFHDAFLRHLARNSSWYWSYLGAVRWNGMAVDSILVVLLALVLALIIVLANKVSTALVALALVQLIQLLSMLQVCVQVAAETENLMAGAERMLDYTHLPQEEPNRSAGDSLEGPPPGWPTSGALEFHNVVASYRPGLPPVLCGLSFTLPAGSSCGIAGRTGSGKSTLALVLFRLLPLDSGAIYLDGVDISSLGLKRLRQQLTLIPQDPLLFSGTLRSNLDPQGQHPDADLWRVLERVQLKGVVTAGGGLEAGVVEGGSNLSVGQRQLLCMARALLAAPRVLVLDEATANVDGATDALIQAALQRLAEEALTAGRVIITIAHRVNSLLDYDQLLVMSAGRVVEAGAPRDLAIRRGSSFGRMLQATRSGSGSALGSFKRSGTSGQ